MNLKELLDQVFYYRNTRVESEHPDSVRFAINLINDAQHSALGQAECDWAIRTFKFRTETTFSSGTVDATQDQSWLPSVGTGNVNQWTPQMLGRKIFVGGSTVWYEIYDLQPYPPDVTRRALFVDPVYQDETTTGATYTIYKDEYPLPGDYQQTISVRLENTPRFLRYIDPWEFTHRVARLIDWSPGLPEFYTIWNKERVPIQEGPTTAFTLNQNSTRVDFPTATFSDWDVRFRGATLRWSGGDTYVREVPDDDELKLYEPWRGATTVVTGFEIVPKGQMRIGLWPIPNQELTVEVQYYHLPTTMTTWADVPILPEPYHDYLWKTVAYQMSIVSASEETAPKLAALKGEMQSATQDMLENLSRERDKIYTRREFGAAGVWPFPWQYDTTKFLPGPW